MDSSRASRPGTATTCAATRAARIAVTPAVDHGCRGAARSPTRSRRWTPERKAALRREVAAASTDRCAALDARRPLPHLRGAARRLPIPRRADPAARELAAGRPGVPRELHGARAGSRRCRLHPRSDDAVGDGPRRRSGCGRRWKSYRPRSCSRSARFRGRCLKRCIEPSIELDHPKFHRAEIAVFTKRVVTDCMSHGCTIVEGNK